MRAPNTYPTRGVRGIHEPHGVRLRSTDFPQYRQIDQRARNNDVASAPEFREKRHICTIKYVFRTLHLGMAPGVSNRPSKKKNGTYCCRSIAYQVHKHVQVPGTCSFGLFNYDSFVSFRAIGVIWGIRELTAELVCLLFWSLLPCPYPVGDSSLSLPCGGLFLVPTLWGTLLCSLPCYGTDNQDMKTICTWTARE